LDNPNKSVIFKLLWDQCVRNKVKSIAKIKVNGTNLYIENKKESRKIKEIDRAENLWI
jgi:hypothetical protein